MHACCVPQLGKVRGQLFNPLPDAPKADDLVDKVPSSLKKLMELKVGPRVLWTW